MTDPADRLRNLLVALIIAVLVLPAGADETADYVRSHYSKFEYMVPMRDGVELFTAVYVPNDATEATYPILMIRTPYSSGPYGADEYREYLGPTDVYAKKNFIFVYQDVRGKFMSGGEFVNMRPIVENKRGTAVDESTDTYDTIEWLVRNVPRNNGKVGLWGVSYPGFYASAGMIDSHPALKAVSPQAPIADWFFDDMHRNGAFNPQLSFMFFSSFGQPREGRTTEWPSKRFDMGSKDAYRFFLELGSLRTLNERYLKGEIPFWNDVVAHPDYDEFWQSRNILPRLDGIEAAVLVVGGWYDTEDLYGPLRTYEAVERMNPGIFNVLVMGPWSHGAWSRNEGRKLGEADFGFATSEYFLENIELPFFEYFLKGDGAPPRGEANMFETGANRWRRFDAWPPRNVDRRRLFLHPGGELGFDPPSADGGSDSFVSDPAKPVPYTAENTARWARDYMTEDQRFAARRPDVLVYESEPLEEDLTVAGPMMAELRVATTGTDADWIVKVIDVYPAREPGYTTEERDRDEEDLGNLQRLVRAGVIRGRFRESFETPEPFVPGEVTPVEFELYDVLHTFKRGHRIMVQIQSTWFPFIDRNPQKFVPNIFEAEDEDFVKAEHTVHHSEEHPSALTISVLGK